MAATAGSPRRAIRASTAWLVGFCVTLVHVAILGLGWPGMSGPVTSEPGIQWVEPVADVPLPTRALSASPPATAPNGAAKPQPNRVPPVSAPPPPAPEPLTQPAQTPVAEPPRGAAMAAPSAAPVSALAGGAGQVAHPTDARAASGPAPLPATAEVPSLSMPSERAAYLNNPPPAYPAISRRLGEQGRVVIRVYIDERGEPIEADWAQRSGYSRLDQAAMDAVMAWRYVPAKRGEVPVAMWFNVPIAFDLKQHKD